MKIFVLRAFGLTATCIHLATVLPAAEPVGGVAPMNLPQTLTADVSVGATSVTLDFNISHVEKFRLDVVVPVDGATLSLKDPDGVEMLPPGTPNLEQITGAQMGLPLPGGVFVVKDIAAPKNGTWTLKVQFPASPVKTVVLATLAASSLYQTGIVLERTKFVVGEEPSIGLLVLNGGSPVTGASALLQVTRPDGTTIPYALHDDGAAGDGLAGDGIYSSAVVLSLAGSYALKADVEIPGSLGVIKRSAFAQVQAAPSVLSVAGVQAVTQIGSGGCVESLLVQCVLQASSACDATIVVALRASNNSEVLKRTFVPGIPPGSRTVALDFSTADLKSKLGVDGPYQIASVKVFAVGDTLDLQYTGTDLGQTPTIRLADLCSPSLEIGPGLKVSNLLKEGYIETLAFSFPVTVNRAGDYSIACKVLGALGEEVKLLGTTRYLDVGSNEIVFEVPSENFLKADGPYTVGSALVLGPAGSAQASFLGQTPPLQKWQFYPLKKADLNTDGVINAADREILTQFRNTKALNPGDRRDLNRDGAIDLKDVRELTLMSVK